MPSWCQQTAHRRFHHHNIAKPKHANIQLKMEAGKLGKTSQIQQKGFDALMRCFLIMLIINIQVYCNSSIFPTFSCQQTSMYRVKLTVHFKWKSQKIWGLSRFISFSGNAANYLKYLLDFKKYHFYFVENCHDKATSDKWQVFLNTSFDLINGSLRSPAAWWVYGQGRRWHRWSPSSSDEA